MKVILAETCALAYSHRHQHTWLYGSPEQSIVAKITPLIPRIGLGNTVCPGTGRWVVVPVDVEHREKCERDAEEGSRQGQGDMLGFF